MLTEFGKFLDRARAEKQLSLQKFADLFPISRTRLSDVMHGRDEASFGVENCFRLAEIVDETPSTILRRAGKNAVADLIEAFYGRSLTPSQVKLLDLWSRAPADAQAVALGALKIGVAKTGARHGATSARPAAGRSRRRSPKRSTGDE